MPTGNVKWFDTKKGYGFIIGEAGQDIFVHYTSIVGDGFRSLKDGEVVDYDLVQSEKGLQARNVRRQAVVTGVAGVDPKTVRPGLGSPPPAGAAGAQGSAVAT